MNISLAVFFGHLTPDVEGLRYQHLYHPVPVEQKSPGLANVLNQISSGRFGDAGVFEPYVKCFLRPCTISTHLLL
jgi:glycogen phosphorylase